jgi:multiple sugar transport system substrate-binding protein
MFGACGASPPAAQPAADDPTGAPDLAAAPADTDGAPLTLQWWDYYGDLAETDAALNAAIAKYEAEHPNIDIQRTSLGFSDLKPKIIQAAATNTMPDIVIIDNPDHQAMAEQGALADLTEYIPAWPDKDQYFAGPWSSTVYQGKNYGVPFESNATALYYNQDALTEASISAPPATWDELRAAAQQLTAGDRSGLCFSAKPDEEGTFTFLPFLWQAGGDLPTFGDEASIKALSFWNTLVNEDGSAPKSVLNMGQGDAYNQFIAGKCAMMINGPWQLPNFANDNPQFAWGVAPWPQDVAASSILGGENFAAGNGENVAAAWEVIRWMATPENVKAPLLSIGLPNRQDTADDPDWTSDPNKKVFVDQVAIARPRAYGANYPQISEQVSTAFQRVLTGDATPETAAQEAGAAIQPLLPAP